MDVSLERNIQQALGNNRLRRRVDLDSEDNVVGDLGADSDATQMSPTRQQTGRSATPPEATVGSAGNDADSLAAILEGAVIAMSSRLLCRREELTLLAQQLGCRVLPRFDAGRATHLVHQSTRERETLKDYQLALQNGVHVVSPWWLYECRDTMSLVPEGNFPYTYNRDRRLALVTTSQAPPKQHRPVATVRSSLEKISPSQSKPSNAVPKHEYSSHAAASLIDTTNPGPLGLQAMSVTLEATDKHEIGSLFGMKAAGTRRKYRQAINGVEIEGPEKLDIASETTCQPSRLQKIQQPSLSGVPSSNESIPRTGASVEGMQTPDKWWLNAEPTASSRFAAEFQASMYSQDSPPNNCRGLDSLPCTNAPTDSADQCAGSHYEPGQLAFYGDSQANQSAVGNSADAPISSPLVAHKTTIVYGEDADALSERDRLIKRLIGK
ncbi:protein kinase activating protein dpb11 [Coemansia aciculifera]|uniref:Protein kinase activating protein dpb11 n=1 Tax=Coemansia aciculifera TaxID=417176 RepID=A0ACC1LWV0_9FUNG|nr:protein kinase activating protein dpb11 [Coemansia aciculifera]